MKKKTIKKTKTSTPITEEQKKKRAEKREKLNFEKKIRSIFLRVGLDRIKSDGNEIKFHGRTGEFDDIFLHENVIIILEYYSGQPDTSHLLKKKLLFDLILEHKADFIALLKDNFKDFSTIRNPKYRDEQYAIRIVYACKHDPSSELHDTCHNITLLYGSTERYFTSLIKSIELSARNELFKFLKLEYNEIGEAAIKSSHGATEYSGFLLPDGHSNYPDGYKIVSFYADPESLIDKCYVLRRDSWREDYHTYQRIVRQKKNTQNAFLFDKE